MRFFAHERHTRYCYTIVERQPFVWPVEMNSYMHGGTSRSRLYQLQVVFDLPKSSYLCVNDPGHNRNGVAVPLIVRNSDVV